MSKMNPLLNNRYFRWLISQIQIPNDNSYLYLFERMHNLEFIWTIPNDDNRIQDALDLRKEFEEENPGELKLSFVSLFEILICLSRRLEFTAGGSAPEWAWQLLDNLNLIKMSDPVSGFDISRIDDILYTLVWRTYNENGEGGFFPLKNPKEDQTKVEIWYQMNAYVIENQR